MMRLTTRFCWLALLVTTGIMLAGFVTSDQGLITIRFWPATKVVQAEIWIFVLVLWPWLITGAGVFWFQNLGLKARLWSKAKQISELEARIEETEQQLDDKRLSGGYG